MTVIEQIHQEAFRRAENYRGARGPLIEILMEVEAKRVFERYGYSSLFRYCLEFLKLGEDEACTLIAIARKSREVPEIKELVDQGKLTISNARRIVPVVNAENKDLWLEKAQELTQTELLQEIVKVRPEAAVVEKIRPVAANVWAIQICGTDETHALWERALDVMAQKLGATPTKNEILAAALNALLEREDPVRKAERATLRAESLEAKSVRSADPRAESLATKSVRFSSTERCCEAVALVANQVNPVGKRTPIPASILHRVRLRDRGRCRHVDGKGSRCGARRFLQVHHILPVAKGGANEPNNLITLCSVHHNYAHLKHPVWTGYKQYIPGREDKFHASANGPRKIPSPALQINYPVQTGNDC